MTFNWHDRSVAPERLWDRSYIRVIEKLKSLAPWFATGRDAVRWFKLRRSAVFEEIRQDGRVVLVRATAAGENGNSLPGMRLRVSRLSGSQHLPNAPALAYPSVSDELFETGGEVRLAA